MANAIMTGFGVPLPGPIVRVDTEARALWPDHPFIHAQDQFAKEFGSGSLVAVAVVVRDGNIFTPERIKKIQQITQALDGVGYDSQTDAREERRAQLEEQFEDMESAQLNKVLDREFPPYPVNHDQIRSISHRSTRVIQIEPDGSITSDLLMKQLPESQQEADELRALVRQNPPFIFGRLVSRDEKGALITAGFVTDRLSGKEVYQAVFDHIQDIKYEYEDAACHPGESGNAIGRFVSRITSSITRLFTTSSTESSWPTGCNFQVFVSGEPVHVGWILKHAYEIGLFVVLTVVMIFALLLAYFRRLHGVLIPFIAAICTVIWGTGFTGWMGITFDPLVLVIPMIITARAVSHTVQMAERFFEDYELLAPQYDNPNDAKVEAATIAMGELVVPGTLGIITDVAGLLVIMVTTIPQMQDLAKFGSFWVLSILATVEILHPVMICYLPAPKEHEHFLPQAMVAFTRGIGNVTTHSPGKYFVGGITVALFVWGTWMALFHSKIGQATPGSPLLWPNHEFNVATGEIAERFGGVDQLVIYSAGDRANASGDAKPVLRMEEFERWMKERTNLGATLSLVPFIAGSWQMNHYGDPKWGFVPDDQATVRQIIFQLQTNGPPGFLRPYMTDEGKNANISFFYPDHKGETIVRVVHFAEEYIKDHPTGEVAVRLDRDKAAPDAGYLDAQKLTDMWYYMLGPLLPTRHHTLTVRIRQQDGSYQNLPVKNVDDDGPPDWIEEFQSAAHEDFENTKWDWPEDEHFPWPDELADWETDQVGQWFENTELGIQAVEIDTDKLLVKDIKAVESIPRYQLTNSWTRGMQFVMAGGTMGILAAINDEVERSHVANISLIFFVIFVLHSTTYQSVPSGFIILLQIATATMLSLAYMAVRGVGLNINTLPVQSVGVGIGVDYAIYIVDRIRQEVVDTEDIDEAVRRAVRTTGMAVSFTATTIVGGIALWMFSNLRFQAEMAQLLVILMIINMLGALTVVPAFYSILRPKVATALLTEEQMHSLEAHKELERQKGLRDD
jgi:predicted RND superfamily exporter protein